MTATQHGLEATALTGLAAIPVGALRPSPNNVRECLTGIDELGASIRENGLIQPLVVQKVPGHDGFQIVAGHRRFAAVQRLGWAKVPCVIRRDMLPDEELLAMLVENGQRAGLDPIEEARALNRLKHTMGIGEAEVARRIGRPLSFVTTRIMLLSLAPERQEEVRAGVTTLTAAKEEARVESGRVRPNAIGRAPSAHLSTHHPLAERVKTRCVQANHSRGKGVGVGGVACGECWEAVIRADERERTQAASATAGRCLTCGTQHQPVTVGEAS